MKKLIIALMVIIALGLGGCTTSEMKNESALKRKAEINKMLGDGMFERYTERLNSTKGAVNKLKIAEYEMKYSAASSLYYSEDQKNEIKLTNDILKKEIDSIKKIEEEDNERIAKKMRKSSKWVNGYYVNNYGEKTDKEFFAQTVLGKFSNSATVNNELSVAAYLQLGKNFTMYLKEYSTNYRDNRPDTTFIGGYIHTYMINEKGEKFKIMDKVYESQTYTRVSGEELKDLVDFFKNSEIVKIKVIHGGSSYNFKLNTKIIK